MIKDAMGCDGIVLIAWEHQDIPGIANLVLGNSTTAPQKWPGDRFDIVWIFYLQNDAYLFSQVPQRLLAGDGDTVISFDWGEKPANHQFTRLLMGFQYSSSTSLPELK